MVTNATLTLRRFRLDLGLTQFVVAKRAGLSASRLSLLERGHDEPTDTEKSVLARVLGTTPDQLFPAPTPTDNITSHESVAPASR
jgi:transcriptional regulator with XRE-family HTH domain